MELASHHAALHHLNETYLRLVKEIKLLSALNWPVEARHAFMQAVTQNAPAVPPWEYTKKDYTAQRQGLQAILAAMPLEDVVEFGLLKRNVEAYLSALEMMEAVGTSRITELSKALYGSPQDVVAGYDFTVLQAAQHLLREAENTCAPAHGEAVYTAEQLREYLLAQLAEVITGGEVEVRIDAGIASRAMALGSTVMVRADAHFTHAEAQQLLQHEVFTHALCSVNGQAQPFMACMGVSSPRITATQEGLAQCAELMTGTLYPQRVRRIALRVIALDMAEQGANARELFSFFQDHGDTAHEATLSVMRILRGGTQEGGIIFYKDGVYVRGMLEVFRFISNAKTHSQLPLLFAGNVALADVDAVAQLQQQGVVTPAKYLPYWAQKLHVESPEIKRFTDIVCTVPR